MSDAGGARSHDIPTDTPSVAITTPITGWDSAALAQVEKALEAFIGPMARVLVRNAAKTSTDMRGLGNALIEHIAEPVDRSAFLHKVGAINSEGVDRDKLLLDLQQHR